MLKVLKSGFFSTIQDTGRYGLLNKGVPVSGQMDAYSASKVNQLLENQEDAALMEITMTGPTLAFDEPTFICFGGADMSVTLNNEPIEAFKIHAIQKGDILSYGRLQKGFRSYLGVKDGFRTKRVLGSRSFYFPLTEKSHITDGMEIEYETISDFTPKLTALKVGALADETLLTVSHGPEFEILTHEQLDVLFDKEYSIAKEYNRMAYQLQENLSPHQSSILTSATMPGTVQLTPSGKIIILMRDGQTTGGYPRILQLTKDAINILAQKKYGDKIIFKNS